ncbi:anthrax toxin receptor-like [Nycticebus coucang]|uniref:anthrax toxin receptor-like n=1 Tax=Nycticebus coucang TaxID=9470 RepID=UPI00234CD11F|nr:anthrax toxin receptor-like [Nycticebus coucang]
MGIHGPRGPYSALLLLLLLLLPPPLFKAGSFQHPGPRWRIFNHLGHGFKKGHYRRGPGTRHQWRQGQTDKGCQGVLDLYFIIDKSGSVNNNWIDLYMFIEDSVKKFQNPNTRISLITYSTGADIILPLTADRDDIRKGLSRLQRLIPEGHTFMQYGFKKAIQQMKQVSAADEKVTNMIIAVTDGTLMPHAMQETLVEAQKARDLGATIYTVGVAEYDSDQIKEIADSEDHVFGVENGFKAMRGIVDELTSKTCIEITSVEPTTACKGEPYEVIIHGKGFQNTKGQDEVICRFTFGEDKVVDEKPVSMDATTITCPGPKIKDSGEKISVSVSLNNGHIFHSNEEVTVTSTDCEFDIPYWVWFLPLLLLLPLLLWLCWRLCCKKTVKEPPPEPVKKPKPPPPLPPPPPPPPTCPTVVVCCSGCHEVCAACGMRSPKDNLHHLCNLVRPNCSKLPFVCYPRKVKARHPSLALMQPRSAPCNPKISLPSCQERCPTTYSSKCHPITSLSKCHHHPVRCPRAPSRMLPILSPSS